MPAIIDHDQRRDEIAACAASLIATGGIEAATVRAVASRAGFSSKVVSHYFDDKRSLLLATYQFAAQRSSQLTEATQATGTADVATFVKALLPTTTLQRENWLVWYAFWAYAISDETFALAQQRQVNGARARISQLLAADPLFIGISSAGRGDIARSLLTEVIGVSLQAIFDHGYWTRARQHRALDQRLQSLVSSVSAA